MSAVVNCITVITLTDVLFGTAECLIKWKIFSGLWIQHFFSYVV